MKTINDLDTTQMFLLLSIKLGLSTSYDFLSKVGMSVNSSSPRLREMEQNGLLIREDGSRGKMDYSITKAGHDLLDKSVERMASNNWDRSPSLTLENLPYTIVLAWVYSGVDEALYCVRRAEEYEREHAWKKRRAAIELGRDLDRLRLDLETPNRVVQSSHVLITVFAWIKAQCSAEMLERRADSVKPLEPLLAKLLPDAHDVHRDAKRETTNDR